MLEAAKPSDHLDEKGESENFKEELDPAGEAVSHHPAEEFLIKSPGLPRGEPFPVGFAKNKNDKDGCACSGCDDGGNACSHNAEFRKRAHAVDHAVIQRDVDRSADHVDDHDGPCQAASCVEAGYGGVEDDEACAQSEHVEVGHFERPDMRGMADEVKDSVGKEHHEGKENGCSKGEVNPLPQGGADPVESPGACVLGDKDVGVIRNAHKKGDEGEGDDAGRQCGGDGVHGVVGQKHPVRELHDREGSHGGHQRQADRQHLTVSIEF